jgi:hypothetical protein
MANCLWNDFEGHMKLHLADWGLICRRKEFGGLGIPNLANVNLCILASWIKGILRIMASYGKPW